LWGRLGSSPLHSKACPGNPLPGRRPGEDHPITPMRVRGDSCCSPRQRPPAANRVTNNGPRALMTGLLGGTGYTMKQASYDLARMRTSGLIARIPGKTATGSPATDYGLRSSTPNSTTGYYAPCSPPTAHQRHRRSSPKSITHHRHLHHRNHRPGSPAAKSTLKTQDNCQRSSDPGSLATQDR
jgi:hypothetical protein